jgi:hypothetical protein
MQGYSIKIAGFMRARLTPFVPRFAYGTEFVNMPSEEIVLNCDIEAGGLKNL